MTFSEYKTKYNGFTGSVSTPKDSMEEEEDSLDTPPAVPLTKTSQANTKSSLVKEISFDNSLLGKKYF